MIESSTAEVWRCTICDWVWFKSQGKIPNRCPNPKCRKAVKMADAETVAKVDAAWQTIVDATVDARRRDLAHDPTTCRVYRCGRCTAAGKKF